MSRAGRMWGQMHCIGGLATISLMSIALNWKAPLLVEYSKDCHACEILDKRIQDDQYRVISEVIYYNSWIYLVPNSQLREKIMQVAHDSPLTGHQGLTKTYRAIRDHFPWTRLKDDVLRHVRECDTCQRNKGEQTHPTRLLQPLPIPERKWESMSMDFITGLPVV